jgi:hypothetical protein
MKKSETVTWGVDYRTKAIIPMGTPVKFAWEEVTEKTISMDWGTYPDGLRDIRAGTAVTLTWEEPDTHNCPQMDELHRKHDRHLVVHREQDQWTFHREQDQWTNDYYWMAGEDGQDQIEVIFCPYCGKELAK